MTLKAMLLSMRRQLVGRTVLARAAAQVKLKTSYASPGTTNAIWNLAKERGCDKKHGLDVAVVYIGKLT